MILFKSKGFGPIKVKTLRRILKNLPPDTNVYVRTRDMHGDYYGWSKMAVFVDHSKIDGPNGGKSLVICE